MDARYIVLLSIESFHRNGVACVYDVYVMFTGNGILVFVQYILNLSHHAYVNCVSCDIPLELDSIE